MEKNFGGPVWHASAAPIRGTHFGPQVLRAASLLAIKSVGDERLGQWEEYTGYAYHVRRRLSLREQRSIGAVIDVRGTPEAERRIARVQRWLPSGYSE